MDKKELLQQSRKVYKRSRSLCMYLFFAVLIFFCVLGFIIPLRPVESEMEKRKLEEFPEFSIQGVLSGSYFSDISLWYSDSYPLRDLWMQGSDRIQQLYGIKTNRVISSGSKGDLIPDAPYVEESTQAETEEESEAGTAEDITVQPVEQTTSAQPSESMPAVISGQAQNGLYVEGDTAYGMYFFNLQAAKNFINTVNSTADRLKGISDVYTILVPMSEAYALTDEQRKALEPEWANELEAMDFYVKSFNGNVKNVPVYETLEKHQDEYIYFRTDHHWTGLGAYYTYTAFAELKGTAANSLDSYEKKVFPGFLGTYYTTCKSADMEANPDVIEACVPLTSNTMTFHGADGSVLNWPIIHDVTGYKASQKYSCFAAGDNPFSVIENPNAASPESCVVIKDSYADAFIPYLTDHYQHIYWFDYRSYGSSIMEFILGNNINDVIFLSGMEPITSIEITERLNTLMKE